MWAIKEGRVRGGSAASWEGKRVDGFFYMRADVNLPTNLTGRGKWTMLSTELRTPPYLKTYQADLG